ncbi:hypothetical protein COV93_08690 [Candidatus Woesearchaeota archaeon CG11_big_fil_rev_8_21_14_0_20_43_8]|nr:MAG: hypothetical protein COV93_08690 [Candidatus Woesearchaeota archaeon CG11_big_fil_rev_8_21_14_0_20_43_8]PIO08914.1 MAG: hypothetical protein COT47_00665 [Candidatus Woesearchaeota archaeon CG08_land_8_20_14_0_20_43_7]
MVLKTFNVHEEVYKKFSGFCKAHGLSMSKQVDMFMQTMVEEDPEVREDYLEKLERLRKGRFIRVENFAKRYG